MNFQTIFRRFLTFTYYERTLVLEPVMAGVKKGPIQQLLTLKLFSPEKFYNIKKFSTLKILPKNTFNFRIRFGFKFGPGKGLGINFFAG